MGWKPSRVAEVEVFIHFFRAFMAAGGAEWEGSKVRAAHAGVQMPTYFES